MNLEPQDWSRAEVEEEEEEEVKMVKYHYVDNDISITCNELFVGVFGAGSAFLETIRSSFHSTLKTTITDDQNQLIASIYSFNQHEQQQQQQHEQVFVQMERSIEDKNAIFFVNTLLSNLQVENRLIVIDTIKVFEYKADVVPFPPHVTCIQTTLDHQRTKQQHTTSGTTNMIPSHLPSPNIKSGLTASLLSHCQMYNRSAIAMITLEENHRLESISLVALEKYLLPLLHIEYQRKKRGQFDYVKHIPKQAQHSLSFYL